MKQHNWIIGWLGHSIFLDGLRNLKFVGRYLTLLFFVFPRIFGTILDEIL